MYTLLSFLTVSGSRPSSSWEVSADRTLPRLCSCTVVTWWWCQDRAACSTMPSHASSQHLRDTQLQRRKAAAWHHRCRTALWWSRCRRRTGWCAPRTSRAPEWTWLSDRCWRPGRASQKHPLLTKELTRDRQWGTMTEELMERAGKGRGVVAVTADTVETWNSPAVTLT